MITLSGLSGAGKSTASKALEDQGYFVVDNLPAELFCKFVEAGEKGYAEKPLAFVIDSREAKHLNNFVSEWKNSSGVKKELWFLEASDSVLVRRFQETRRPHPIDKTGEGLLKSIQKERELLAPLKEIADRVLETDSYNPHQLRAEIGNLLGGGKKPRMPVRVMSFGFRNGPPEELDLCFVVRFIENPYFVAPLKAQSGIDQAVREFVLSTSNAKIFLEKTCDLLKFLIPCYESEGKSYLTIAIGCTAGHHRSVALAQEISRRVGILGYSVETTHRDLRK